MIEIRGRMIRKPVSKVTHFKDRFCVRIDDERNPEFWVELWFTDLDLSLIEEARAQVAAAAAQVAAELGEVGEVVDVTPVSAETGPSLFDNPPGQCPRCGAALRMDSRGVLRCPLCSVPRA